VEKLTDSTLSEHVQFILELESEDPHNSDPALVEAVGRDLVEALRREHHIAQSVYMGQKGGNIVVDIWLTLAPFLSSIWGQQQVILEEGSALVTILGAGIGLKRFLQQAHEKRMGKNVTPPTPIRLTLEVGGLPVPVEVPDLQSAEALIAFAHRLQTNHPSAGTQVTLQSKVKAQARLAKRPKSTRR